MHIPFGKTKNEITTMDAYCVKCKERTEMVDYRIKISDSGRQMAQGVCKVCGFKVNRILGKVDAPAQPKVHGAMYDAVTGMYTYIEYKDPLHRNEDAEVYTQENPRVEADSVDELRFSGYMTIDEFVDDLAIGIREYLTQTFSGLDEDEIYHPEDLAHHAGCFLDSLAIAFGVFGSKARA